MGICPEAFPFFGAGTFINLSDSPEEYTLDDAGKVVRVNQTFDGVEFDHLSIEDLDDVDAYDRTDAGKSARVKSDGTGVEWSDLEFQDLSNTPGSLEAGMYPKVNEGATALEWAEAGQATEHYKLGPTPNRFVSTAARDAYASDRANEAGWLQEYIDDGTNLLRVVDTSTDPEEVVGYVEPTKTVTDNTVFTGDITDIRGSLGLQDDGVGRGAYYINFTGADRATAATALRAKFLTKPANDRLLLKYTGVDPEEEYEILNITISEPRARSSVWGKTEGTFTFPAKPTTNPEVFRGKLDPDDTSEATRTRVYLIFGTNAAAQTARNNFKAAYDGVPGTVTPFEVTVTQGGVARRAAGIDEVTSNDAVEGSTTTYRALCRIREDDATSNPESTRITAGVAVTAFDVTGNFSLEQSRCTFALEGDDPTPFSALPGVNDWDIVDRDISVAWRKLAGTGAGNTVYTDNTLAGDGTSEADRLRVVRPLPDPSGGDAGDVVARNAAGTGFELVAPAEGGSGTAGTDNIVYATASKTYNATETNALSGKIVYAMSDSDITLTFSDPRATSDRGFVVLNMGANDASVTLDATPTSERDHVVVLQSPGDAATCTWDDSADKWEFIEMGAVLEITSSESFSINRTNRLRDRVVMCRNTSDITITVRTPRQAMSFYLINASPNDSNVQLTTNSVNNRERILTSTELGQTIVAAWDTTDREWKWKGNWEINPNPQRVSETERDAGTETGLRDFSPSDVKDMIDTHAAGGSAFDLHDDVTTKQSDEPNDEDRLLVTAEDEPGDPQWYLEYGDLKRWIAQSAEGRVEVIFTTGTLSLSAADALAYNEHLVIWSGSSAVTVSFPSAVAGGPSFLLENRGGANITIGTTVARPGESIWCNLSATAGGHVFTLFSDREGSSSSTHYVSDTGAWSPVAATVSDWYNGLVVWAGSAAATLTLPTGLGATARVFVLLNRGGASVTHGSTVIRTGEDARFNWNGTAWSASRFIDRETSGGTTNSDIIHSEVGNQTLSRANSIGNDGKHIFWRGTADATWTFADMNSDDSAFVVIESVDDTNDLTLRYTGAAANATTTLEFGDLAVMQWNGTASRWYVHMVNRPEAGGDSAIEIVRTSQTYTVAESAALSGKMLFCLGDAEITLTLTDPGGSLDLPVFVRNFAPSSQRVVLTTASSANRSHVAYLTGGYDSAVCVWDDSVNRWEFTVTSRNHAERINTTADVTYDLSSYWPQWRSNTVLVRTGAGNDPVVTLQPNAAGTWAPSAWEKGDFIEFHPMWSSGRIQLKNFKFARHNSDGRIEGFDKSATARNATEGFGEPFRLVYEDYYVNTISAAGTVTGELYQWHVMPLAQDVRAVIEDYDTTAVHKTELQAVEGKIDQIVSHGDKTLTAVYWPLFDDPGSGSGWQAYEYNTAIPSGHSLKLEIAKGDHKVFFREYNASSTLVKEFDLLRAFKDIGLYGDRDEILEGNAATYLGPTITSNAVTAAQISCVVDVYSGRILSPCPADVDVTLTAGTILRAYGKKGTANPLTQGNRVLASGTETRGGITYTAGSLCIFGKSSSNLQPIHDMLYDGATFHSDARVQVIDADGDHHTLTATGFELANTVHGFNAALDYRRLDVTAPATTITPGYGQPLRIYRDVGIPSDWSREGSTDLIPADKFDASYGQSTELFDANFDLTTSAKRTSNTSGQAVRLPSDGLLWFYYGDGEHTGFASVPCRMVRDFTNMSAGDSLTAGTDTAKQARQVTLRMRIDANWRFITIAKDDSGYLLIGTTDSATAGDDPAPLKIWHIASGVTVDAESEVAGEVIATDTFTVPATGDIVESQLSFSLDANAPSGAGYSLSSSGRNVFLGHVRRLKNHIGYLVQCLNSDDEVISECIFPLMQDEASKYGYILVDNGGTNRAAFRMVYDSEPGAVSTDNSNMWVNHVVIGRGTTFTATEVTIVVRELVVPAAQGAAQSSPGSASGAFTTVSRSEFVRQAVSGTTVALGGSDGYQVDDEATHLRVEIAAPANFTTDAFLYYLDPADDGAHIVYDSDGDEVTVTGGNTTTHRFNSAFFHLDSGSNYVKLQLRSAAAMVGSDLSIDIHHETDINSATVEPFDLLSTSIRPAVAPDGQLNASLTGLVSTEYEFANYVLYEDIIGLVIHLTSDNTHGLESADVSYYISKEELDYVGEYTSFIGQTPIKGWHVQGWINPRGTPSIGPLRARPDSEHVHWLYSASRAAPSILFGYVKTGLYLKGLRMVCAGSGMLVRKVACMRKI